MEQATTFLLQNKNFMLFCLTPIVIALLALLVFYIYRTNEVLTKNKHLIKFFVFSVIFVCVNLYLYYLLDSLLQLVVMNCFIVVGVVWSFICKKNLINDNENDELGIQEILTISIISGETFNKHGFNFFFAT